MAEEMLRHEVRGDVALVRLDDGKANAISPAVIDALHTSLGRAERESAALVIEGRPGRFSGGFDLGVMRSGDAAARTLVAAGAELWMRMLEYPLPCVVACTGHAIAAGALFLLAADRRVGAQGDFRIGLNEVAIGLRLPLFALEMARERLSKRHLVRAALQAELYSPDAAVDAGFLDRAVPPAEVLDAALADAGTLAKLPRAAFAATKRLAHGPLVAHVRESLAADLSELRAVS